MAPIIPRSTLWDRIRDAAKPLLKALGLSGPWRRAGETYHWATVFVNYALMRFPLSRWMRVGAWPQSLYIEGTNICNAKCVFCAYPLMERGKGVMPMEDFRRAVEEYAAMGGAEVDLTPIVGDPFADRHLFERLDTLAALPGIRRFHFFTNAILMRPEQARRLAGYGGRLSVYNSFGGFDRETYHRVMGVDKFAEAVEAIRGLIQAKRDSGSGVGIQVNLRVPRGNARGGFWEELKAAEAEGLITIDSIDAYDSWAGQIRDEDLRAASLEPRPMPQKRGPCHRLLTSPVVLVDGRVNACACRDVEAQLIIGDLKTQALSDVLGSPALHDLLERHGRGDFPEVCRRCTYYDSLYPSWMRGALFPLLQRLFR